MPRRNVVESFPVSFSESRIRKSMKGTTCPVCSYSRVRTAASADCLCSGTQRQRRVGTLRRAAEVRASRLRAAGGGRRDGRTQSARRGHAPRWRSRAATVPCTFKFPSTGQLKNRQAEPASKRERDVMEGRAESQTPWQKRARQSEKAMCKHVFRRLSRPSPPRIKAKPKRTRKPASLFHTKADNKHTSS